MCGGFGRLGWAVGLDSWEHKPRECYDGDGENVYVLCVCVGGWVGACVCV